MSLSAPSLYERLRQLATQTAGLLDRLVDLTREAHAALDRGETESVLGTLIERECLLGQIDPALQELTDMRERLAGGCDSPLVAAEVRSIGTTLAQLARHTHASDAMLAKRLDAACAAAESELARHRRHRPAGSP